MILISHVPTCPKRPAISTPVFTPHNLISTVPSPKVPADVIFINHVHNAAHFAMSLPTSRRFLTQLLDSLPSSTSTTDAATNPLSSVPEAAKKQLLSLQVLFPNEFLPALDLLDRGLVTRLRIQDTETEGAVNTQKDDVVCEVQNEDNRLDEAMEDMTDKPTNDNPTPAQDQPMIDTLEPTVNSAPRNSTYYVRSAQHHPSRYTSYDTTTSYEVRLLAWNCSCPAFAFAAFPAVHPEPDIPYDASGSMMTMEGIEDGAWIFGGMSLGDTVPPVCKHLLACVLVEKCSGLFGGFVEEREVGVEEAVGWAAGWGD